MPFSSHGEIVKKKQESKQICLQSKTFMKSVSFGDGVTQSQMFLSRPKAKRKLRMYLQCLLPLGLKMAK